MSAARNRLGYARAQLQATAERRARLDAERAQRLTSDEIARESGEVRAACVCARAELERFGGCTCAKAVA